MSVYLLLTLSITYLFLAESYAADCQKAREYIKQAASLEARQGDLHALTEKERWYKEAIALCPNAPEAHNNLGYVYENLSRYAEALVEYQRAVELRNDYFRAYYGLGDVYFKQGQYREAITWYEQGLLRDLDPSTDTERRRELLQRAQTLLRRQRIQGREVLSEAVIVALLEQTTIRGPGDPVKLTLGTDGKEALIPFDTNRHDLREDAKVQLNELGKALSSPPLSAYDFELRGFADSRGSDDDALELSRRRAEAVQAYLVQHFRIPAARLKINGYGKDRRLIQGHDEASHAINRRVEVVRLPPRPSLEATFAYQDGRTGHRAAIGADGKTVLRTGIDQYQLYFRPHQACYVYLLQKDPTGTWSILFPHAQSSNNPVQPGKDYWVPRFDKGFPVVGETKGAETLYLLAAPQQVLELEFPARVIPIRDRGSAGIGPMPGEAPEYETIVRNFSGFVQTITFIHE